MESISYSPLKVIAFNAWLENKGVSLWQRCFSPADNPLEGRRSPKAGICLMIGMRVTALAINVIELALLPVNFVYALRDMKHLASRVSRMPDGSWWAIVKVELLYLRILLMASVQSLGCIIAPELVYPHLNPLTNRYMGALFTKFLPPCQVLGEQLGIHLERLRNIEPALPQYEEEMNNTFSLNSLDGLLLPGETSSVTLDTFSSHLFLPLFLQFLKRHTSLLEVSRAIFEDTPAKQSLVFLTMFQVLGLHMQGKSRKEMIENLNGVVGNEQQAALYIDFTALFLQELLANKQETAAFFEAWTAYVARVPNQPVALNRV